MSAPERGEVTRLLQQWRAGDREALDALTPLIYDELRQVARARLGAERAGHTLEATALVHEAYLRLAGSEVEWRDRVHFFALAARTMRRILVDHARSGGRAKRGGGAGRAPAEVLATLADDPGEDLLELDDALERLAAIDERKVRVIELLFFAGLTYDETAEALEISPATVHRDLDFAKAWLQRAFEE